MTTKDIISLNVGLTKTNLNLTQLTILACIKDNPLIRVGKIGEKCGVKSGNVSIVISALGVKGLIEQRGDEENRRISLIELTKEGERLLNEVMNYSFSFEEIDLMKKEVEEVAAAVHQELAAV